MNKTVTFAVVHFAVGFFFHEKAWRRFEAHKQIHDLEPKALII